MDHVGPQKKHAIIFFGIPRIPDIIRQSRERQGRSLWRRTAIQSLKPLGEKRGGRFISINNIILAGRRGRDESTIALKGTERRKTRRVRTSSLALLKRHGSRLGNFRARTPRPRPSNTGSCLTRFFFSERQCFIFLGFTVLHWVV